MGDKIKKIKMSVVDANIGKGATISGFMDRTEVSNSTITHDGVKSIMSRHHRTQNSIKEINTDDRMKKMCSNIPYFVQ